MVAGHQGARCDFVIRKNFQVSFDSYRLTESRGHELVAICTRRSLKGECWIWRA